MKAAEILEARCAKCKEKGGKRIDLLPERADCQLCLMLRLRAIDGWPIMVVKP